MRKKLKILAFIFLTFDMALLFINKLFFTLVTILFILALFLGATLMVFNALYKKTNHWKNQFLFEKNFISSQGYRDNLRRNLDVVNLGSNPARFGMFYENVCGQNWATGSQGLEMDFEILKCFHSYLREGGTVLIPIMPFTAISQYIKEKKEYWNDAYYMKFAMILDYSQTLKFPNAHILQKIKYPLIFDPTLLRYVFVDVPQDGRWEMAEQIMSAVELEQDADMWINGWKKEFDAADIKDFICDDKYLPYREEAVNILKNMIGFCISRNLEPVILTIPMSGYLADKFDTDFRQRMIYDFVEELDIDNLVFLDYMFDSKFNDSNFYNGSFFMNLKGRKLFSAQVMKDLELRS